VTARMSHILEACRALFHEHPDAVHLMDTQGHYVQVNEQACRILGRPRSELIGRHYSEFVATEERERLDAIFEDVLRGHPRAFEHACAAQDGTRMYVTVNAMPLLVDGCVAGVYAITQDVTEHRRMEGALRDSEMLLRAASHSARVGGWLVDLAKDRMRWSDEVCAIHEMPVETAQTAAEGMSYYAPESIDRFREVFQACRSRGTPFDEELEIITARGRRVWVRTVGEAVRDPDGAIIQVRGAIQDISKRKSTEAQLRRVESHLSWAMEAMSDAFLTVDRDYRYTYVNREAERLLGRKREEMIGKPVWDEVPDLSGTITEMSFRRAMDEGCTVHFEFLYEALGKWMEVHVYPAPEGLAVYLCDIDERKRAEEEVQSLAFYDPLTGLPNRRLLMDRLQQSLAASHRLGLLGTVLFLDLDNFKTLNDTLGHSEGDALLRRVAERLASCVRATDTVARFGGDEYVVVLGNLGADAEEAMAQAELMAKKILAALRQPSGEPSRLGQVTCSIGITLFGMPGDTVERIIRQADLAMYQAKASGRNIYRRFDPGVQSTVHLRVQMEEELRRAVEEEEFVPYYQPQVDIAGKLSGAEALARWNHPQRGILGPSDFIHLAEESGLIFSLGPMMLEYVCRHMAGWTAHPQGPGFRVAVNISARQFHHPDFVQQVISIAERTGADPRQLRLELTEGTLLLNMEDTISKMKALRSCGIGFALDDFGTGYSSLYYLKHLPLDQIKIDQRFVRGVLDDSSDAAIVRAIIVLAQSLGLDVIAEGVESTPVRDFLVKQGCLMFQGFLHGHPIPRNQFEKFFLSTPAFGDKDIGGSG
jgi:diguanylate cyclase (GGDEF)-like protein/PAS domain S-box-containing protein